MYSKFMTMTSTPKRIVVALVVVFFVGGLLFYFKNNPLVQDTLQIFGLSPASTIKYTNSNNPYKVLNSTNPAFAQADTELKLGNATSAIADYQKALLSAADKVQQDQIRFKIAAAEGMRGNTTLSIQLYKAIINDTGATPIVRAYAVEDLGLMWNTKGKAINDELFKDEPFKSLFVENDPLLTQRKIYDMANDIFPLMISEFYSADWYASGLEKSHLKTGPVLTADQEKQYVATIRAHIEAGEKIIKKRGDDPNIATRVALAYLEEATLERVLALTGYEDPSVAEAAYKKALAAYDADAHISGEGIARFQFARFLLQIYKDERIDEIRSVLAPIYDTDAYVGTPDMQFFRNEKDNIRGRKKNLVQLSQVDPKFKQMLVSLGWSDSDFVLK